MVTARVTPSGRLHSLIQWRIVMMVSSPVQILFNAIILIIQCLEYEWPHHSDLGFQVNLDGSPMLSSSPVCFPQHLTAIHYNFPLFYLHTTALSYLISVPPLGLLQFWRKVHWQLSNQSHAWGAWCMLNLGKDSILWAQLSVLLVCRPVLSLQYIKLSPIHGGALSNVWSPNCYGCVLWYILHCGVVQVYWEIWERWW